VSFEGLFYPANQVPIHTKVIVNPILPGRKFAAITLFGLVFTRDRRNVTPTLLRHELIHCQQQLEWLYIPFFILYLAEWIFYLIRFRGDFYRAYRAISFEREAYANQCAPNYLQRRPRFANYRIIKSLS